MTQIRGWVYIIVHPAMPGLLKVGHSLRDPILRAKELEGTGIPGRYTVAYSALVLDPKVVEAKAHVALSSHRESKEWFRCPLIAAYEALHSAAGDSILFEARHAEAGPFERFVVRPCKACGRWLRLLNDSKVDHVCTYCQATFRLDATGVKKASPKKD